MVVPKQFVRVLVRGQSIPGGNFSEGYAAEPIRDQHRTVSSGGNFVADLREVIEFEAWRTKGERRFPRFETDRA